MKRVLIAAVACAALSLTGGCLNVLATRNPCSDCKVEHVYQATRMAAGASVIVAFPQMMAPTGSEGLEMMNVLTIPLGLLVLCDAVCEIPFDTICIPYDILQGRDKK